MKSTSTANKVLTRAEIAARSHKHPNITEEQAHLQTSGVLDVSLLMDAGAFVPESLQECQVVSVRLAACTKSHTSLCKEAVYEVTDSTGTFQGHYFSGAFKQLLH